MRESAIRTVRPRLAMATAADRQVAGRRQMFHMVIANNRMIMRASDARYSADPYVGALM